MSDHKGASAAAPESINKTQLAIESLSTIIPTIPTTTSLSSLLHDPTITSQISSLLRQPNSGAGDNNNNNNICRWLYDTFQSSIPHLQLFVLRFIPLLSGLYLSRLHTPQPAFEAVLLSFYAFESNSRNNQAITVTIPDLSHPSIYHQPKSSSSSSSSAIDNDVTKLDLAVVSHSLEPYGMIRSTRRARIVGVTLELYYRRISEMPIESKIELCEFCKIWAGQNGDMYKGVFGSEPEINPNEEDEEDDEDEDEDEEVGKMKEKKEGRIPLPWELLQPVLRILGHCLMGVNDCKEKGLFDAASDACRCLYARALHDLNPKAILATESLLRLSKRDEDSQFDDFDDYSNNVISL